MPLTRITRIKSSAQRKIVVASSEQAVLADIPDYKLKFVRKHPVTIICVFLTIAICSVYLQVKDHQFIKYDDEKYVTENSHVLSGLNLENIKWAFTNVYAANWHPLTWISHMMDVNIFGMNPGMHHLTNVIFHVLNSILLLIVLNQMTGALWRSAAVATLFALHPLHVESVAWIAERKDVLSTFFWMLTMLAYHRYVGSRTISKYLLMILFFGLGLMAKPMLVTLPFVLLLLDFWPLKREELNLKINPQRLILEKVPLMIMALAASRVTFYAQSIGGAVNPLDRVNFASRIQNVIISYVVYLWKMIWPLNLAVFYPYPKQISILTVAMCFLLLIAITVIVVMSARKLPYLITGWFWYLGTLVPVIGIVQVGIQSMADRYTYIPLIGIFVMIAWGIPELLDKRQFKKIALVTLTGIVIPILIVCSWRQVGYWKSNNTLFKHDLDVTVNNVMAHNNLGVSFYEEKNYNDSFYQFQECLKIDPKYFDAYIGLGNIKLMEDSFDEAISYYSKAEKIDPNRAEVYNGLGVANIKKGYIHKGINYLQKSVLMDSNYSFAIKNLENAKTLQIRHISELKSLLLLQPENLELYYKLVSIYSDIQDYPDALSMLQKMRLLQPGNPEIYYNIACIYAKQNKVDESISWLKQAIEKGFNNWNLFKKDPDLASIRNTTFINDLIKFH
jgi:hypothetical protein